MTPKERAAMQQALEALDLMPPNRDTPKSVWELRSEAITALREALAEQAERVTEGNGSEVSLETEAQEPVAWASFDNIYEKACKSSNPQDWMEAALLAQQIRIASVQQVDLTDDEIERTLDAANVPELPDGYKNVDIEIARAVIAAYKEKNK